MKPFERNQSFALKRSTYNALAYWIDDGTWWHKDIGNTLQLPKSPYLRCCESLCVCVCGTPFGWQLTKSQGQINGRLIATLNTFDRYQFSAMSHSFRMWHKPMNIQQTRLEFHIKYSLKQLENKLLTFVYTDAYIFNAIFCIFLFFFFGFWEARRLCTNCSAALPQCALGILWQGRKLSWVFALHTLRLTRKILCPNALENLVKRTETSGCQ